MDLKLVGIPASLSTKMFYIIRYKINQDYKYRITLKYAAFPKSYAIMNSVFVSSLTFPNGYDIVLELFI